MMKIDKKEFEHLDSSKTKKTVAIDPKIALDKAYYQDNILSKEEYEAKLELLKASSSITGCKRMLNN